MPCARPSTAPASWAGVLLCGLASTACALSDTPTWPDQLEAGGPCWNVDLADGLTPGTTAELQHLAACLDKGGLIAPVRPVIDALDAAGPDGVPVGVGLVSWLNSRLAEGLDVSAALTGLADRTSDHADTTSAAARVLVELLYGESYRRIDPAQLADPTRLDSGLVVPALPLIEALAYDATTDGGLRATALADLIAHPSVDDILCTTLAIGSSQDAQLQAIVRDFPAHLGQAIDASRSPDNDRMVPASPDSIRQVVSVLQADDHEAWQALQDELGPLLRADGLGRRMDTAVAQLVDEGRLDQLAPQLRYLATVDRAARPVPPGAGATDTALTSLLRLLSRANEPATCTVDLGLTELDIDLGNLAVAILEQVARLDPDTVTSGADILSTVLGFGLTDSLLRTIADSGACPAFDAELVDDLAALDRLSDREAEDLLHGTVAILGALQGDGDNSQIPALVDTLDAAHTHGLTEPLGELIIDLGPTPLVRSLVGALGSLADPAALSDHTCPQGGTPLRFVDAWDLADDLLAPRTEAAALARLGPTLSDVAAHDATWAVLEEAAPLLTASDAELNALPDWILDGLAAGSLPDLAPTLRDPAQWRPLTAVAATPAVHDALRSTDAPRGGPLPFGAALVMDGTLDSLLRTVALAVDALPTADAR